MCPPPRGHRPAATSHRRGLRPGLWRDLRRAARRRPGRRRGLLLLPHEGRGRLRRRRHGCHRRRSAPPPTCGGCAHYGMEQEYHSLEEGYNSRLDEVQAALLRLRLPLLAEAVAARRAVAAAATLRACGRRRPRASSGRARGAITSITSTRSAPPGGKRSGSTCSRGESRPGSTIRSRCTSCRPTPSRLPRGRPAGDRAARAEHPLAPDLPGDAGGARAPG